MRFIVLSSSRGTTFQAVIDALRNGTLTATCLGLITDRPDRGCIAKAQAAGLPVKIVEKKEGEIRENYDHRLLLAIEELIAGSPEDLTLLAAMGWMRIFSPWFIKQWKNRILNVHPALLPAFGGEGMYGHHVHEAVLQSSSKRSGVTIHLMDEDVDTGKILVQKKCSVKKGDTSESLQKRVQELEKEWYPKTLQMIQEETLKLLS